MAINRAPLEALHSNIKQGRLEEVKKQLAEDPTLAKQANGKGFTPLYLAAQLGWNPLVQPDVAVGIVQALLDAGADATIAVIENPYKPDFKTTPLHYAIGPSGTAMAPIIELLLRSGADQNAPDSAAETPLQKILQFFAHLRMEEQPKHKVNETDLLAAAKALLADPKANVNQRERRELSELTPLMEAIIYNLPELALLLIQHPSADLATPTKGSVNMPAAGNAPNYKPRPQLSLDSGQSALEVAQRLQRTEIVAFIIEKIRSLDLAGLFAAIQNSGGFFQNDRTERNLAYVEMYCRAGLPLNVTNQFGVTPFLWAVIHHEKTAYRAILMQDPETITQKLTRALSPSVCDRISVDFPIDADAYVIAAKYAAKYATSPIPDNLKTILNERLNQAAAAGETTLAVRLIELGAEVNSCGPHDFGTPLLEALIRDHRDTAQRFLSIAGIKTNAKLRKCVSIFIPTAVDKGNITTFYQGDTALHIAASLPNGTSIIERLGKQDASHWVNEQNELKETALYIAARENHPDAVKALLALKADPNITNGHGETPLMVAARSGHHDVAGLLLATDGVQLTSALTNKLTTCSPLGLIGLRQEIFNVGLTALQIAQQRQDGRMQTLIREYASRQLARAAADNDRDRMIAWIRSGANPNVVTDGIPLIVQAQYTHFGYTDIVMTLLSTGQIDFTVGLAKDEPLMQMEQGQGPLHAAVRLIFSGSAAGDLSERDKRLALAKNIAEFMQTQHATGPLHDQAQVVLKMLAYKNLRASHAFDYHWQLRLFGYTLFNGLGYSAKEKQQAADAYMLYALGLEEANTLTPHLGALQSGRLGKEIEGLNIPLPIPAVRLR